MPAAFACSSAGACSTASKPLMTMPSGFSAIAWPKAAVRPPIEPAPSMHLDLPADRLGRFLDAGGDAENAAILQIAGEHDDGLAFLRLRAGRRAVPGGDLLGVFLDDGLGVGHRVGPCRPAASAAGAAMAHRHQGDGRFHEFFLHFGVRSHMRFLNRLIVWYLASGRVWLAALLAAPRLRWA